VKAKGQLSSLAFALEESAVIVFKNSVEGIPRRSTETVRNEEHHNYPSTKCIMIIDGNSARKGRICASETQMEQIGLY
jgi:hypothetical protein